MSGRSQRRSESFGEKKNLMFMLGFDPPIIQPVAKVLRPADISQHFTYNCCTKHFVFWRTFRGLRSKCVQEYTTSFEGPPLAVRVPPNQRVERFKWNYSVWIREPRSSAVVLQRVKTDRSTDTANYPVNKKSLCTWWLQYICQVYRDFLITLYLIAQISVNTTINNNYVYSL